VSLNCRPLVLPRIPLNSITWRPFLLYSTRRTSCLWTIRTGLSLWCVFTIIFYWWLASAQPPRWYESEGPYKWPDEDYFLLGHWGWLLQGDSVSESNLTAAYEKTPPTAQIYQSLIILATNHDSSSAEHASESDWAFSGSGKIAVCTQCGDEA